MVFLVVYIKSHTISGSNPRHVASRLRSVRFLSWRTCHVFFPSSLRRPPPPHPASNPPPPVPNKPNHHHHRVPRPSPVPFHAAATPNLKRPNWIAVGRRPSNLTFHLSWARWKNPDRPPCETTGTSSPTHVLSPPLVARLASPCRAMRRSEEKNEEKRRKKIIKRRSQRAAYQWARPGPITPNRQAHSKPPL